MNDAARADLERRQKLSNDRLIKMHNDDRYTLEIIPTHNKDKFYLIKTYIKGGIQTVNQLCNGIIFYRRWEQYSKSSIAIVRS